MFKTLVACKCGTLVCESKEATEEKSAFYGFNPDDEYVVWRHFHLAENKCDSCHRLINYFVHKKEVSHLGEFQTFRKEYP